MNKPNHAPEPWEHIGQGCIWPVSGGGSWSVAETASHGGELYKERLTDKSIEVRNAKRIVACVNGCKGIAYPATTVPKLVNALKQILLHGGESFKDGAVVASESKELELARKQAYAALRNVAEQQ